MARQPATGPEALPLPKGGGSTRGLGDAFTPDLNRGTGSYGIEIVVPKGHRTLTPSLSLAYHSANGDGPFGLGWTLAVAAIQRNTDRGVGAEQFLLEGETLVEVGPGRYRQQVENAFYRIRRLDDGPLDDGPLDDRPLDDGRLDRGWEIIDKTGGVTVLGDTPATRITDGDRTFAWLAASVRDTSGNELRYEYLADGANRYLTAIRYAAFEVRFELEPRPDVTVSRRAGFPVRQALRVRAIEVRRPAADQLIRRYTLSYQPGEGLPSLLARVDMEGFKEQPDGTVVSTQAPPVEFQYTPFDPGRRRFLPVAFDPAGPPPLDDDGVELVDLTGDGLPDVLQLGTGRPRIWPNQGAGRFATGRPVPDFPQPLGAGGTLLLDADGTGSADLVHLDTGMARYYPNNGRGGFDRPRFLGGRRPLAFSAADPDARVADLDGDGRVDLVRSTARGLVSWRNQGGDDGFAPPTVAPAGADRDALPDVQFSQRGVRIADMTGDGLPDIVRVANGLVEYWPSLGGGRYDRRRVPADPPRLPRHYDDSRLFLADVDGLGASDVVYVDHHQVLIWRNLGGERFAPPLVIGGTPGSPGAAIRLVDLMGTGTTGVLWSDVPAVRGSRYRFLSLAETKPYLLTTVTDAVGTRTTIEYGSSSGHAARAAAEGRPWQTRLPIPVPVVDRISRVDLVTGAEDTSEIRYYDGRWDGQARRFRGFARVVVRRLGEPAAPEAVEEYHYHVGGDADTPDVDIARRGQMHLANFYTTGLDSPLQRTEATRWAVRRVDTGVNGEPVVCNEVTSTEVRILEGGTRPRVVTTEYTYDEVGNVTRERRVGSAPAGDDNGDPVPELIAVTEVEYAANDTRYVRDRVSRIVKRDGTGAVQAEVRHYYDGAPFTGLPLGEVEAGLLVRQEEVALTLAEAAAVYGAAEPDWRELGYHPVTRIDGVAAIAADTTRYAHSGHGMVTGKLDPLGGRTEFGYDDDGLLVVRLVNAVGHVRTASYDPGWQLIEEHTGPDGSATRYTYDGLGRLSTVVRPGDTAERPTLRYRYHHLDLPNAVVTQRRRRSGEDPVYTSAAYFDGQGREIQLRTLLDGDQVRVSGPVRTSRRGDPVFKGVPTLATGLGFQPPAAQPGAGFRYAYDSAGRLVRAVNLDGEQIRVAYTPWSSTRHDAVGAARTEHVDTFGRLVAVTVTEPGGARHRANFAYDVLGRVVASTDLAGRPALRAAAYDARGARLRIDHATAGVRTAVFDARRRLVSYADGNGSIVSRQLDAIGRLAVESVNGVAQETYHYHPTSGRLTRVDDNAGSVEFGYDERGRVTAKQRTILGTPYQVAYGYDAADLQSSIGLPDGATVAFERWGDGRVRAASGFVDLVTYDEFGRLGRIDHSNGLREEFGYHPAGTLARFAVTNGARSLYASTLERDPVGRLTRCREEVSAREERYSFDGLGHLSRCERDVDGASTVWDYQHDPDGNLLRADEMQTDSYEYDFGVVGALTRRVRSDGTADEIRFDAAGQLTAIAGQEYEYDARGRLIRVVNADGSSVDMIYDYRGARVAKAVTVPGGGTSLTRYVDELYEDHNGIGTGYVFVAGRLVGRTRGTGRRHLHADHRGSVVLVTDTTGGVDGRGWFHPFGQAELVAEPGMSRQFTGAVFDPETGLYYLNLRFYRPDLGRFLTPDPRYLAQPERELDFPEAHNLYAYCGGDPVDYTDPTGQGFWETFGKVLAAIVVVVAVVLAVALVINLIAATWPLLLAGAAIGAVIGGIAGGWEGAAIGAMMGATIGVNYGILGPLGLITVLGVFPGIRKEGWYHSLAGWTSWLMPASWPGHILGLGVFLGNVIAHVFGSDKQIESMKFDWKHGQILTAGGEYGGDPFPWLVSGGPSHNLGGFSFWSNDTWQEGGKTWQGIEDTVDPGRGLAHETGHMLSNAQFGFWQGVVNGIENLTTSEHDDRFFEKLAQSNVPEADRTPGDQVIPFWT